MIVVLVFAGLVLIRLVAAAVIVFIALSVGPACPACRGQTIQIHVSWQRFARWLERRWCTDCGWEGLVRRGSPFGAPRPAVDAHRAKTS